MATQAAADPAADPRRGPFTRTPVPWIPGGAPPPGQTRTGRRSNNGGARDTTNAGPQTVPKIATLYTARANMGGPLGTLRGSLASGHRTRIVLSATGRRDAEGSRRRQEPARRRSYRPDTSRKRTESNANHLHPDGRTGRYPGVYYPLKGPPPPGDRGSGDAGSALHHRTVVPYPDAQPRRCVDQTCWARALLWWKQRAKG